MTQGKPETARTVGLPPRMVSALGQTPSGDPLSANRAPCESISPWVARVYATQVDVGDNDLIECGLISDTSVLRVLFSGDWTATTRDGTGRYGRQALLFGPQKRRMEVSVRGSFATVGLALKPGAVAALRGPKNTDTLDRIIPIDYIFGDKEWGRSEFLLSCFEEGQPAEHRLRVAEKLMEQLVENRGGARPDPIMEDFDRAVFEDPSLSIAEFAEEHDIERRRLERVIKAGYGLTATQVLRRARALDIASHLLGVADDSEAEEAALRFFDQSHMIREFKTFFGMTPRQFTAKPQPFMTLTLEARQARRLEVLGRTLPGQTPPWREAAE